MAERGWVDSSDQRALRGTRPSRAGAGGTPWWARSTPMRIQPAGPCACPPHHDDPAEPCRPGRRHQHPGRSMPRRRQWTTASVASSSVPNTHSRERVVEALPRGRPALHFLVGEQAGVEPLAQRGLIDVHADHDDLLSPIAVAVPPVPGDLRQRLRHRRATRPAAGPRTTARRVRSAHMPPACDHCPRRRGGWPARRSPSSAARPATPRASGSQKRAGWNGTRRAVDEAADAVLRPFPGPPAPRGTREPLGRCARPPRGRSDACRAVRPGTPVRAPPESRGPGIQVAQNGFEFRRLLGRDEVDLVDDDQVGELHLIDQQVDHRPLVVFVERQAPGAAGRRPSTTRGGRSRRPRR